MLDACEGLAAFPEKSRRAPGGDVRELVTVRPYVIIYRLQPDEVVILRVIHGARLR
ncbi:MAG: type II toxin-antitoxin system RelE/ParE family toxin [Caulobacteraceae bacterium]|nr:type II toxin-antitoxin system RelE/ParE family toxin [Caulobacter sp.]